MAPEAGQSLMLAGPCDIVVTALGSLAITTLKLK